MSGPIKDDFTSNRIVYLDFNATTPLEPEVIEAISYAMREAWANPSSQHEPGRLARAIIDESRNQLGLLINATAKDMIFTSGGTEANNWVIQTALKHYENQCVKNGLTTKLPHFITSTIEHDAIKLPLEKLVEENKIELTQVAVNGETGRVLLNDIVSAVKPNTVLITVMLANNETGVVQPLGEIAKAVRMIQKERKQDQPKLLIHTDAAQAIGKIPVDVEDLGVDFLTIVGHKFYGPRIGALYIRDLNVQTPLYPMLWGGGQERGFRPGTENTPMIAGLGKAAELITRNIKLYERDMEYARNTLEEKLKNEFSTKIHLNSRFKDSPVLPNTLNISFVGKKYTGKRVLDLCPRIQASVGAACHVDVKASSVLLNCGIPLDLAVNAIRLSVGRQTSTNDIDIVLQDFRKAITIIDTGNTMVI